jgi:hypothetical protein
VRLLLGVGDVTVGRTHAHCADAVGAELQEDSEIVLVGGSAGARLAAAEPSFGSEMLEEGMKASAPVMVANACGQGAGDVRGPLLVVDETRIAAGFAQAACGLTLEGDDGGALRDTVPRSIFLRRCI